MHTRYNTWLEIITKNPNHYSIYRDWFETMLGSQQYVYNIIINAGFENLKGYFSVVLHERYFRKFYNGHYIFISRDGQQFYNIEFGDMDLCAKVAKITDSRFFVNADSISLDMSLNLTLLNEIVSIVESYNNYK